MSRAFEEFLARNRRVWDGFVEREDLSGRCILVDFFDFHCEHPTYLAGNALVASYLGRILNCRLVALTYQGPAQLNLERMARSYGMEGCLDLDLGLPEEVDERLLAELSRQPIEEARSQIARLSVDGLPIGDLAYDDYLRSERVATIERVDRLLLRYIAKARRGVGLFREIFASLSAIFGTWIGFSGSDACSGITALPPSRKARIRPSFAPASRSR